MARADVGGPRRHCDTLQPNWLRNQRENALIAEKPSNSATDASGRSRLSTYRKTSSARTESRTAENVLPSRARCRCTVRRSIPSRAATDSAEHNPDGSLDLYIGPDAPAGAESNWMKTVPPDGWFVYFRLYAPIEPWFDKSWSLPDFEPIAP